MIEIDYFGIIVLVLLIKGVLKVLKIALTIIKNYIRRVDNDR